MPEGHMDLQTLLNFPCPSGALSTLIGNQCSKANYPDLRLLKGND